MTRLCLLEKEKKKNFLSCKYKDRINILKNIIKNKNTLFINKKKAMIKMHKIPKNAHAVRKRNRCYITGRARGYFRRFKMCRHAIKSLAVKGEIPGLFKASW